MFGSRVLRVGAALALVALPGIAVAAEGESESTFGFNGIGGQLGLVLPEDPVDATFELHGFANLGAPFSSVPELVFMPGLTFWSGGTEIDEIDFTEFGILLDALYMFPRSSEDGVYFFAGGGLGIFFTSFDIVIPDFFGGGTRTESQSDTDFGLTLVGGLGKPMSENLDLMAQARFKFDGIDTIGFLGGVQYRFAK